MVITHPDEIQLPRTGAHKTNLVELLNLLPSDRKVTQQVYDVMLRNPYLTTPQRDKYTVDYITQLINISKW